jgi:hypothetical protein
MSVAPCSETRCQSTTRAHCSLCRLPYCRSHLFPVILATGMHITLCAACFQEQDERVLKSLNTWQDQEKGIPITNLLDTYPEESPW